MKAGLFLDKIVLGEILRHLIMSAVTQPDPTSYQLPRTGSYSPFTMSLLLTLSRAARVILNRSSSSPKFLLPGIPSTHPHHQPQHQQCRFASIVSDLQNVAASYNRRIRRGRGASSGKGKTSGRGHKGQKQHGSVPVGFEGGQTSIAIVHGPRGWINRYTHTSKTTVFQKDPEIG